MTDFHGEFKVFEDAADLTHRMAELIVHLLGDSISHRGRASLVVSGGTTPVALFEVLSGADLTWETDSGSTRTAFARRYICQSRPAPPRGID